LQLGFQVLFLDAYLVADALHVSHFLCNGDRFVNLRLAVDEAADLHQAFSGFRLQIGTLDSSAGCNENQ
jgi:hypothetical protein